MGIWAAVKYALNSTLGTTYFNPLDNFVSAKLMCRGKVGTTFTVTSKENLCKTLTAVITEDSFDVDTSNNIKMEIIPIPLGLYSVKIELQGLTTTEDIEITEAGRPYYLTYNLVTLLQRFTAAGTFTIPSTGSLDLLLSAAGGGGGGGASRYSSSGGGGGGGGGAAVYLQKINKSAGTSINITIGIAGSAGRGGNSGGDGGTTVVGDIVTLVGGRGGSGSYSQNANGGEGGASGGIGGGSGGNGGASGSNSGESGDPGVAGKGGNAGYGGGGGGSLGDGGNGGNSSVITTSGTYGGGGGGANGGGGGGAGGEGVVEFYKGVIVA